MSQQGLAQSDSTEDQIQRTGAPSPWRCRAIDAAWLAPSFILILSAFVPLVTNLAVYHYDWLIALSELHSRPDIVYGRDVIYTCGPLGFLWGGYHPKTFIYLCIFWIVLAVIVWWAIHRLASGIFREKSIRWTALLMLVLILPLGGDIGGMPDLRLMLPGVLLLLCHYFTARDQKIDWLILALSAILGVSGVIKFTCLVVGVVTVGFVSLDQIFRRRLPLAGFAFVIAVAAGWMGSGQSLFDFPNYIRWSAEFTAGYSEAMTKWLPNEGRLAIITAIVGLGILTLIGLAARSAKLSWRAWPLLAGLGFLLLTAFRHGYVRHDLGHELITSSFLMILSLLAVVAAWRHVQWRRSMVAAWVTCAAASFGLTSYTLARWPTEKRSLTGEFVGTLAGVGKEVAEIARLCWPGDRQSMLWAQWKEAMTPRDLSAVNRLPTAPIDGFTDDLMGLFRYGLNYSPRPTLQGHSAYTPGLAKLNADKYAGPTAPDLISFLVNPMDNRLPTLEDNQLWLEMMKRYEILGRTSPLLMRKRPFPREAKLVQQFEKTMKLGESLELTMDRTNPRPPLLWAKIEVRRKPLAGLASQFYKPDALSMVIKEPSEDTVVYRFVPSIAADGFLLGPVMRENEIFASMMQDSTGPERDYRPWMPTSITIRPERGGTTSWYFEDLVTVKLYTLTFDPPR